MSRNQLILAIAIISSPIVVVLIAIAIDDSTHDYSGGGASTVSSTSIPTASQPADPASSSVAVVNPKHAKSYVRKLYGTWVRNDEPEDKMRIGPIVRTMQYPQGTLTVINSDGENMWAYEIYGTRLVKDTAGVIHPSFDIHILDNTGIQADVVWALPDDQSLMVRNKNAESPLEGIAFWHRE